MELEPVQQLAQSMITVGSFSINLYAVVIILVLLLITFFGWRFHKNKDINLSDAVTEYDPFSGRERVSITKMLQLLGGVTGTFIVIKLTLQATLTWDIFVTYLAYVASIEGFSKFVTARYSAGADAKTVSARAASVQTAPQAQPQPEEPSGQEQK